MVELSLELTSTVALAGVRTRILSTEHLICDFAEVEENNLVHKNLIFFSLHISSLTCFHCILKHKP